VGLESSFLFINFVSVETYGAFKTPPAATTARYAQGVETERADRKGIDKTQPKEKSN